MRLCPARGAQKLLASGLERSQIGEVLALRALIDAGVQLEIDLGDDPEKAILES